MKILLVMEIYPETIEYGFLTTDDLELIEQLKTVHHKLVNSDSFTEAEEHAFEIINSMLAGEIEHVSESYRQYFNMEGVEKLEKAPMDVADVDLMICTGIII